MPGDNSNSMIHPQVQREIDILSEDCQRRHNHNNEAVVSLCTTVEKLAARVEGNQMSLVELTGKSGKNGMVGQMRQDIAELKASRRAHLKASGIGATLGGGTVYGIIEAIRLLTGG